MHKSKTKVDIIRLFPNISYPIEIGYAQEVPSLHRIGSLFLVMTYDDKYSKLEQAIKSFFNNIYTVHMAKDYMQDILGCICEKIKESDFGIVVLAGLKYKKDGKNRIKMNIPFEYGMLKILEKPVMLIREDKFNIDINIEFSDIQNENHGEIFRINRKTTQIEKRIGEIFKKFIPELARNAAQKTLNEIVIKNPRFPHAKTAAFLKLCKDQYEIIIRNDFEGKIEFQKEK